MLPARGVYDLVVGGQAPWHRHALTIGAVDGRAVEGIVALDRRPIVDGPRDVDEHTVAAPFLAARDEHGGFSFVVHVGAALPRLWSFSLHAVDDATIVGTVDVATAGGRARRAGVVARRT